MSKAFTRESDDEQAERPARLRTRLPPGTVNYITANGLSKLHAELESLQVQKREGVGAFEEKAGSEARMKELQEIMSEVVVPKASANADRGRIRFGSQVSIRSSGSRVHDYQIVGVEEIDLEKDRISWLSPLAKALIGKRAGEKVEFRSPSGTDVLEIIQVRQMDDTAV